MTACVQLDPDWERLQVPAMAAVRYSLRQVFPVKPVMALQLLEETTTPSIPLNISSAHCFERVQREA